MASEPTEQHLQDIGSIGGMLAERITEVARLQALVSEQAREIERLTGEVVRAHYTLAESDCVCERCGKAMDMLGAALAARGGEGQGERRND